MHLNFEYGLEQTWHVGQKQPNSWSLQQAFGHAANAVRVNWQLNDYDYEGSIGLDGLDTLEVRSPVMQTEEQVAEWSTAMFEAAKLQGLRTRVSGWTSGGGHVNVSMSKATTKTRPSYHRANDYHADEPYELEQLDLWPWPTESIPSRKSLLSEMEIYALMQETMARPYVGWVFNDPEDDINAKFCKPINHCRDSETCLSNLGKGNAVAFHFGQYNVPYIECRFFEMPQTVDEQLLHVEFVDAFYSFFLKRIRQDYIRLQRIPVPASTPFMPEAICRAKFKRLLRAIGLCYDDYAHIVERNLPLRFKYGTLV